jgi:4-carboxymuconolactone decarboxylase
LEALHLKSRLPLPDVRQLNTEQRAIHDSIISTRGNLSGPFLAWMHSPGLASPAEKLGAFCRYSTLFSLVESELLILCVAARYQCLGEQQIHEPIAHQAGLSEKSIEQLRSGAVPLLSDERQRLLHRLATELLNTNRIGDELYKQGIQAYGERGMVELVGIVGYYTLVAMTLNAFEMQT